MEVKHVKEIIGNAPLWKRCAVSYTGDLGIDSDALEPVTCKICTGLLEMYFNLATTCASTENKISRYCEEEGTSSKGVLKISDLLSFSCKDSWRHAIEYDSVIVKKDTSNADGEHVYEQINNENEGKARIDKNFPIYNCTKCDFKTIRKDGLRRHLLVHKDASEVKMYKCESCEFKTRYSGSLKVHSSSHNNSDKVFKCEMCNYQSKKQDLLKKHLLVHKDKKYKCEKCNFKTARKADLILHVLLHKEASEVKLQSSENQTGDTLEDDFLGRNNLETEIYKCEKCAYRTIHKPSLRYHQLVHMNTSEAKMYRCKNCEYESKHKKCLKTHLVVHNLEAESYKCDKCSFTSIHKRSLRRHLLVHQNIPPEKMFKCGKCEYETKQKEYLVKHSMVHKDNSELTTYKCNNCDFKTIRRGTLETHRIVHKDVSEVNIYKCELCEFTTRYRGSLKVHSLSH